MAKGRHKTVTTRKVNWKMAAAVIMILGILAAVVFSRPRGKPAGMTDMVTSSPGQDRTFWKPVPARVRWGLPKPVVRRKAPLPVPTHLPTPQPTRSQVQPWAPAGPPQQIASSMLPDYGWPQSEMNCLVPLWDRESGWNKYADNPSSGAYGIPQALPPWKMATAGSDWQTSASTQIRWGLGYIRAVYGSPCGAWSHEEADGWY